MQPLRISKWIILIVIISLFAGISSHIFLKLLDFVTLTREKNSFYIYFLPLSGVLIFILYKYLGKGLEKGNLIIIQEILNPKKSISILMSPLILVSTLITHFFGGSAGREGTAVQMSASLSDLTSKIFNISKTERKIILLSSISAGFSAVFGTPLAGVLFGLEVSTTGKIRYNALIPAMLSSIFSNKICLFLGTSHIHFNINKTTDISFENIIIVILCGIIFGITAKLFSFFIKKVTNIFDSFIKIKILIPFIGGLLLILLIFSLDFLGVNNDIERCRFIGLGINSIKESFNVSVPFYFFLLKIIFTVITLSTGFKGGEVTPLFFIGATLGSFLSSFFPIDTSLLAALGFISVFSGASNTPLTCAIMGIELFGMEYGVFFLLSSVFSYIFSGKNGIYHTQNTINKTFL